MDKSKVTVSQDDRRCYRLRTGDETVDMFGEDYLDEYGISVSMDLIKEYESIMEQYNQMQTKLRDLCEEQYKKKF